MGCEMGNYCHNMCTPLEVYKGSAQPASPRIVVHQLDAFRCEQVDVWSRKIYPCRSMVAHIVPTNCKKCTGIKVRRKEQKELGNKARPILRIPSSSNMKTKFGAPVRALEVGLVGLDGGKS